MTNKEAQITINAIKFMLDHAQYSDDVEEALNMAINALTAQSETHDKRMETHGVCLDTIDRQATLDWLKNEWNGMITSLFDGIKALPSAQPEIIYCGECKHMLPNGRCLAFADLSIRPMASDYCSAGVRK